jgi:hypothetical protein
MKPAKRKKPKMEFTVCCRLTPEEFEEIIDKFYQLPFIQNRIEQIWDLIYEHYPNISRGQAVLLAGFIWEEY